jgi:hypothetical protein
MPRRADECEIRVSIEISRPYSAQTMHLAETVKVRPHSFFQACAVLAEFDGILRRLIEQTTKHVEGFCPCGATHSPTSPAVGRPLPPLFTTNEAIEEREQAR